MSQYEYIIFFQLLPQISCTSVSIRIYYLLPANTTDLLYECLNTKYVVFFQLTPHISCMSVSIRLYYLLPANTTDLLYECRFGLRLNVTVRTEDCSAVGETNYCFNRGRCVANSIQVGSVWKLAYNRTCFSNSYTCMCRKYVENSKHTQTVNSIQIGSLWKASESRTWFYNSYTCMCRKYVENSKHMRTVNSIQIGSVWKVSESRTWFYNSYTCMCRKYVENSKHMRTVNSMQVRSIWQIVKRYAGESGLAIKYMNSSK